MGNTVARKYLRGKFARREIARPVLFHGAVTNRRFNERAQPIDIDQMKRNESNEHLGSLGSPNHEENHRCLVNRGHRAAANTTF